MGKLKEAYKTLKTCKKLTRSRTMLTASLLALGLISCARQENIIRTSDYCEINPVFNINDFTTKQYNYWDKSIITSEIKEGRKPPRDDKEKKLVGKPLTIEEQVIKILTDNISKDFKIWSEACPSQYKEFIEQDGD